MDAPGLLGGLPSRGDASEYSSGGGNSYRSWLERHLRDAELIALQFRTALRADREPHLQAARAQEHLFAARRWQDRQIMEWRRELRQLSKADGDTGSHWEPGFPAPPPPTEPVEFRFATSERGARRPMCAASPGRPAVEKSRGTLLERCLRRGEVMPLHIVAADVLPAVTSPARPGLEACVNRAARRRRMDVHVWGGDGGRTRGAELVVPDLPEDDRLARSGGVDSARLPLC